MQRAGAEGIARPRRNGPPSREELRDEPLSPSRLSMKELLTRIAGDVKELVRTEVALARAELKADLRSEIATATGLGVGALLAICTLNLLLVAAALALALVIPGWGAALVVAGITAAGAGVAAFLGWRRRILSPLARLRRHVKEDIRLLKERLT